MDGNSSSNSLPGAMAFGMEMQKEHELGVITMSWNSPRDHPLEMVILLQEAH